MDLDWAVDEVLSKILTPYLPTRLNMFCWSLIMMVYKNIIEKLVDKWLR